MVIHGKFGFLANPSNPNEFSKYVIQLLNDPNLAKSMGNIFSEHIKNNFNWDFLARKFEKCLR